MARRKKRLEKKRKAQEDAWVARAQKLHSKGEHEAFLASIRRRGGKVPEALAEAYRGVRQGMLCRALEAGDLAQIEGELRLGPLDDEDGIGDLAQAIVSFLAGDDEAARRAVIRVEAGGDHESLRQGLSALVGESSGNELAAPARTVVASFRHLRQMHEAAISGKGTGRKSLDDPRLDAVRQMLDALVAMRHRDHSPGSGTAAKLVAACDNLKSMDPESATLRAVEPRASVLAAVIEADRRVRAGGAGAASRAIDGLESVADRLDILSQAPPLEAVAVHFASRRRLRRLLEAVAEAEGSDGLATLVAARPALAANLALDGRPLDTGSRLIEAVRLRDPWDRMEPLEFAQRVAHLASAETDPLRVAQLMQIELDARVAALDVSMDEDEGPDYGPQRGAKDLLDRIGQMARSLKRMPPPLARETARVLRTDLSELALLINARDGWHGPAEQLLVHLPDDPILLVFAVAGARAEGNVPAFQQLQRRIAEAPARKAPLGATESELMLLMLEGAASEPVPVLDAALDAGRRLLAAADWERFRSHVGASLSDSVLAEACTVGQEFVGFEPGETFARWLENEVQGLSRHLAGDAEFDALRVALACVDRRGAEVGLRIDGYLASHDDLEGIQALYRTLRRAGRAPGGDVLVPQFLPRLAARFVEAIEPGQMKIWIASFVPLSEDLDADGLDRLQAAVERERDATEDPELAAVLDQMSSILFDGVSPLHYLPKLTLEPSGRGRAREAAAGESTSRKNPSRKNEDQLDLF